MLSGAAVLGALAIASGEIVTVRLDQITQESLVALAYLTLVGSLVAFTAYVPAPRAAAADRDVRVRQPGRRGRPGRDRPDETVTPLQVVAGAVIVVGVALIIVSRSRMSGAHDESSPEPVRVRDADEVPTAA